MLPCCTGEGLASPRAEKGLSFCLSAPQPPGLQSLAFIQCLGRGDAIGGSKKPGVRGGSIKSSDSIMWYFHLLQPQLALLEESVLC